MSSDMSNFPWATRPTDDPDGGKSQTEMMFPDKPEGPLAKFAIAVVDVSMCETRDSLGASFNGSCDV